jgi:protein-S-isoprenylcysteine O-methyltransferase Ste14
MSRRVPKSIGLALWPMVLGAAHVALPLELSKHGRRHGWREGRPGAPNLIGLCPLAGGGVLVSWALAGHYAAAPAGSWAIRMGIEPEYLLTEGPYRFSRNPMYAGGVAIWAGWAVLLGSVPVAGGLAALAGVFGAAVRWEEQVLERRFGSDWQAWADTTPRWLGLKLAGR